MTKIQTPQKLTYLILTGMLLGVVFGLILKELPWAFTFFKDLLEVGGRIFVSSLSLLVVPLVFVSLVCGTACLDDIKKLGRVGGKTMGLYLITTAIAIAIALILAILVGPGIGFDLSTGVVQEFTARDAPPLKEVIVGIFPSNPFKAMVEANMLQVIVFAILWGLALTMSGDSGKKVYAFFLDLNEIIMSLVMLLMWAAPVGVFCLIAKVFAEQGFSAIAPLAKYFFTVLGALIVHGFIVYPLLLKSLSGLSIKSFFRKYREVWMFAFSTSSSNATIPINLEVVEHKLGVQNSIASFTIPLGATVNMDGTAIMQGVATVFISQVYGIELGLTGYLMVILTATLASIGTAGVPGVGLITLTMVLKQAGLPIEGVALIIGVDRLLDMSRTIINVTGDAIVTCIVAKSEKKLDLEVYNG